MNAAGRLGLYAAGVVVAFAGAYGISAAVVPESTAAEWNGGASMQDHSAVAGDSSAEALPGLSLSSDGYMLSPVTAPTEAGEDGELSFRILQEDGEPLTAFKTSHDKELHLIVVRSDGSQFTHTHPVLDEATGTWTAPWTWDEAGTYRVFADFAPDVADGPDKVTLTRTVDVAGSFTPQPATETRTEDTVDGFDVSISGDLTAGAVEELTITVTRHLVALRDGDLAYLHVHAEGDEPEQGDTSGPEIACAAEAPTAGRYPLYLDFQVDGQVHTAEFVLDAGHGDGEGRH